MSHTGSLLFSKPNAVQLVVTMTDIEPPIWRRLVVPSSWHLGDLHHVIQAAFGWWDYHLHQFLIGGLRFGDLEQIGMPEFEAERVRSTKQRSGSAISRSAIAQPLCTSMTSATAGSTSSSSKSC